jgi:probable rRNA maturation factor
MTCVIDISIESDLWNSFPRAEARAEAAVKAALTLAHKTLLKNVEISILLTDDARIRQLNSTWRNKDKATNVLSFPAYPLERLAQSPALGDIIVAFEILAREAEDEQKNIENHFSHLVVHGTLHLLGFDHETPDEAEIMEQLERQILASLGIPDPYSGTVALPQPH